MTGLEFFSDLKPFEQFVLFMVLYYRGMDGFVDTIALDFQISSGTARNIVFQHLYAAEPYVRR